MKNSKTTRLSLDKLQVTKLDNPIAIKGGRPDTVIDNILSNLNLCARKEANMQ